MTATLGTEGSAPAPAGAGPRPRPLVIGLDLSLTSTGVAGVGWTDRIRTKLRGDARLAHVEAAVVSYIRHADLVAMEGPSFGHGALPGHEDLAGLRVLVRRYCYRHRIPYAVVPPSSLKLYVAGYGRATKGEIRSAVADRYSIRTEGAARYDEADAYGVLAAACDWLGHRLAPVPETNARALAGCQWPTAPEVPR
ncbi:hypothetical protein [Streptomyces sp. AV19]|uniref:hypothetical protein n=1 Tax=Streptomyces sp. AV19 TaxID=2793068 RepID=UPI0024136C09|nr:hypothetical protein [Streptomyces sp. AV19]MDG4531662.1 hypothetical protein [Streptomyces sp. AV19]